PWMAVILILERFYCAGSLINDLYVLTAAHCVEGVPHELISIRLLEHNRSDSDADVLQRQVNQVKTHELYNPRSFENDIAVIRLDHPVSFEGHVRPICLS
ncbi:CG43124, partial [Drosophila busckii]